MNPGPLHSSSTLDKTGIPSHEPAPDSGFTRRLVAPVLKYLEGRGLLLEIEAREALQHGITIFSWVMAGAVALFAGWLLLATSLVGALTIYLEWSWLKATFIAGSAHILIALIAAFAAWKRIRTARWFAYSLNELKKDRAWLKTQTKKN